MEVTTLGWVLIATAATVGIVDCIPNSPLRLKDLNTPKEELASNSDLFKLLFSTRID
jgi:hypothetical protein